MPAPPEPAAAGAPDNRSLFFASRILPWLLGGLMLGVYGLTLNHWISADSLGLVSRLEGLAWTPSYNAPVTFLITYPFGWLPVGWIPVAVNLFTAVCAALSLVWLARSVTLLPHDLSKVPPPWRRSFQPPGLMTTRGPWLPPLFAVLVCGLQLNFWQNAVTATGQMFNLLLFAYVLRCFLEYNASGRDAWLLRSAPVYGLAVANDWGMILLLPLYVVALVWVKGVFSFDRVQLEKWLGGRNPEKLRLWRGLSVGWLAGVCLFLLLPVLAWLDHAELWPSLQHAWMAFKTPLAHVSRPFLLSAGLISVLPVFLIGLRYYHLLAGLNQKCVYPGLAFFECVYGFFLLLSLWTMFDPPLSPRRQMPGLDSLPLYFLQALSIGYFLGHFLLATKFPAPPPPGQRRRSVIIERQRRRTLLLSRLIKGTGLAAVILVVLSVPTALARKNLPVITLKQSDPCGRYIAQLEQALPPGGAVLLGDDPFQLLYLQTVLVRHGRAADYLLVDTAAMTQLPGYLDFLKQHNPGFNLAGNPFAQFESTTNKTVLATLLRDLAGAHEIYCLHPAPRLDPAAELFFFQPHGLLYQLQPYAAGAAFAGPTPPERLAENEAFWRTFEQQELPELLRRANPVIPPPPVGLGKRFLHTLRFFPEKDREAQIVEKFYAVAWNDWGVELQQAGKPGAAGHCFDAALQLDPACSAAQINQQFNGDFRTNRPATIARPLDTAKSMEEYRDWRHVLLEGAVDEPNFCFMLGTIMTDNQLTRPAIAQLERVRELSPANPEAYLSLARLFLKVHDYTNGLATVNDLLATDPANQAGLLLKANVCLHLEAYDQAVPPLTRVLAADPTNQPARLARGRAYRHLGQVEAARSDFQDVLQTAPNAFLAYFDLAELDEEAHQPAAAIINYELFLRYAPTNLVETAKARTRLQALSPQ